MPKIDPHSKWLLPVVLVVVIGAVVAIAKLHKPADRLQTLDYTALITKLEADELKTVDIAGTRISGELKSGEQFISDLPNQTSQATLADKLAAHKIPVRFNAPGSIDPMQIVSLVILLLT